jgi:hypothetical protein
LAADPGAARPVASDVTVEREVEGDLGGDADRALVRFSAGGGDPPVEPRIELAQLGRRRLTPRTDGLQTDGLELAEQARRLGPDAGIGEHPERPPAFHLSDRARRGGMDDRHIVDRRQEQRAPHRPEAEDGAVVIQLARDGGRRRLRHSRSSLEEQARRIGRMEHHHRGGCLHQGRSPCAVGIPDEPGPWNTDAECEVR